MMIKIALFFLFLAAASKETHAGSYVDYSAVQADITKTLTDSKSFWPAGNNKPQVANEYYKIAN
jgi:hypothetical protein